MAKTATRKTTRKTTSTTTGKVGAAKKQPTRKPAKKKVASKAAGPATSTRKKSSGKAAGDAGKKAKAPTTRYERVLGNFRRDFSKAKDAIAVEFDKAVEATRKRLPKGGIVDEEKLKRVSAEFKERMQTVRERLKGAGEKVSEASERFKVEERARALADVSLTGLHGLASSLRGMAERLEESLEERRPYYSGEMVDGGRYACRECGEVAIVAAGAMLPACAGCGAKKFKLSN